MTAGKGAAEPFVVMAKPVGSRCNLACGYCYYSPPGKEQPEPAHMPDRLLETFIRQYIQASPGPVVSFTWHGGEPTLAGLAFYERAVKLQQKYLPEGWSCWNSLQTNGLLLNDEWCAFLAREHFDVGLSLDGTAQVHDAFRKDLAGGGSYERAAAAVRRLQVHGIQPDLLCTVTSAAAAQPLAVYRALRELETGWIQFIPIVRWGESGTLTPDSVDGAAYGGFLCAIFNEWVYHDLGRVDVQLFAETALAAHGGSASLCWIAPECGRVLVVEQDGGVYSCDHFVRPEHRIGDIATSTLGELVDLPAQRGFGRRKQAGLAGRCRECRWLSLCNGGCPKDRLGGEGERLNVLCEGLRRFFALSEQPLRELMELKTRGLAPGAIMAELTATARGRWKGVGRNDPCPCGSGRKAKSCCWDARP